MRSDDVLSSVCPLTNQLYCHHEGDVASHRAACNPSFRFLHYAAGMKSYGQTRALYKKYLRKYYYSSRIDIHDIQIDQLLSQQPHPVKFNIYDAFHCRQLALLMERHIIVLAGSVGRDSTTFLTSSLVGK